VLAGAKKPATINLTYYGCGHCPQAFANKKDAEAHCVCKCGRLVEPEIRQGYGTARECEKCITKSLLLSARARLRKIEADIESTRKDITRLEDAYKALKDD
jgi:hypothetical protein